MADHVVPGNCNDRFYHNTFLRKNIRKDSSFDGLVDLAFHRIVIIFTVASSETEMTSVKLLFKAELYPSKETQQWTAARVVCIKKYLYINRSTLNAIMLLELVM